MKLSQPIILTVLLLCSISSWSQQDSSYIVDYRDYGNLSLALERKQNVISILGRDNDFLQLRTNNGFPTYGAMFSYKWLNAWVTTSLGSLTHSEDQRGSTDNFGLALGYTGDHWWIRGFYENYYGYHVSNPEVYNPNWFDDHEAYPTIPSLRNTTFYANAYYGFNEETYSHRAMLWQSQSQKRSAGSWLVGVSAGWDNIHADSAILPAGAIYEFYELRDVVGYETYTFGVNVGYTYSAVLSDEWSLGMMLAPGVAATYGEIRREGRFQSQYALDWGGMAEGRLFLSFHQRRWYAGAAVNAYLLTKPLGGDLFNNLHTYIRFNVGYRFTMPKSPLLRRVGLSD